MESCGVPNIDDGVGKLKLDSVPKETTESSPLSHANVLVEPEEDICSKIIIRPAYRKTSRCKEEAYRAGVRRIKEKYDSPNAVTRFDSGQTPARELLVAARSPDHPEFQGPPKSSPSGDLSGADNRAVPNGTQAVQSSRSTDESCSAETLTGSDEGLEPVNESFVFKTLTIPAFPSEQSEKYLQQNDSHSRAGPPTAAKPFYSSFRGHLPFDSRSNDQSRLTQGAVDSGRTVPVRSGTADGHSRPPSLPVVQSFVQTSGSTAIRHQDCLASMPRDPFPADNFPEPPPDFFTHEIERETTVLKINQPETISPSQIPTSTSSLPTISNAKMFPKSEDLVTNANDLVGHSVPQNSSQTERRSENISESTEKTQPPANSFDNSYPRFGTLKASHHHPNSPTADVKCGFLPPGGPGLSDEDRIQVEMFYRSHKTNVLAAKCEANLYFGSARRHSSVLPSKSASARAVESPENWEFIRRGIPVLVLDTGESRRQRRLHIILAERGSGFVLWRDTVDHLTNYSTSADRGFHTMHLSKDHTKLAGLFFSDPAFADDFFDYLSGLTADPDDPLLNLSAGAKRRKDRKASTKRREKRKPIKPEDISMPCCFVHVTKLEHADGLNLPESEQRLQE